MNEGRTRQRLRALLEGRGFHVDRLEPAQGYWRTDVRADVMRWEGSAQVYGWPGISDGLMVSLGSWNTMTDCVRNGIEIERDGGMFFDVSAKPEAQRG